ncbi:TetR/AcrR family transcriptional regulator [Periweissella cryptocerci]|nr:TetR/AcrR family transcriptional regulator [Periweissella cryptocerci]
MAEQRKRGEELKAAIFSAAITILNNEGFAAVNFKRVAEEAGTNRPSLYRRWDTPFDLVFDAVRAKSVAHHGTLLTSNRIDTGVLRDDLIAVFDHFRVSSQNMGREFMRAMIIELGQNNEKLQTAFDSTSEGNLEIINNVLDQARARGEHINEVSDETKLMPFEVLRYQLIITQKDLTDGFITHLVDEVMLPALTK